MINTVTAFFIKKYLGFLKGTWIKSIFSLISILLAFWISGIDDFWWRLSNFPISALVMVSLLLLLNLWLVGFRYWRILVQFSCEVPFRVAAYASLLGHFAGLFVSSLPGQALGRQSVMLKIGISPALNSVLLAYERFLILIISGLLSVIAFSYFVGSEATSKFVNRLPLFEIFVLLVFCLAVNLKLQPRSLVMLVCSRMLTAKHIMGVASIAVLTFFSQLLVLGAFVVAIYALRQDVELVDAFAAAACISFAASMPLTVNGWGVREISSVYVLNFLGISAGDALAISILIGVVSTLLIIGVYLFCPRLVLIDGSFSYPHTERERLKGIERLAALLLGTAVAFLIFFQIHFEFGGGMLNINLADPFAVLSLVSVFISCLVQKQLPKWNFGSFNKIIIFFGFLLIVAFFVGLIEIGFTQWAFVGRVLGWFVLLGYLSAGYLIVAYGGKSGLRKLVANLAIVAISIVLWKAIQPFVMMPGSYHILSANFEGYSANRNTFAFQLLLVMLMIVAYFPIFEKTAYGSARQAWSRYGVAVLGILVVGIVWSGSRAGMLVCALMIFLGLLNKTLKIKSAIYSLIIVIFIWLVFKFLPHLQMDVLSQLARPVIQTGISGGASDSERFKTWEYALRLWVEHPILGAGLGVFFEKSKEWFGNSIVVHSTPLWILAEFGILGVLYTFWTCVTFTKYLKTTNRSYVPHKSALLFILLAFCIFSLFHEIFYQRIAWLLLGALMAFPASAINRDT